MGKSYVIKRGSTFFYKRRVPKQYQQIETREFVRISLKTDSRATAEKRATLINEATESYWQEALRYSEGDALEKYQAAVNIAQQAGVRHIPLDDLASGHLDEILRRLDILTDRGTDSEPVVASVLGVDGRPTLTLQDALEKFFEVAKDHLRGKTEDQIRKWKNPRKKAVRNFIHVVDNKSLDQITRSDTLTFRDWWQERIEEEGLDPGSANKDIGHLRQIYTELNDLLRLGMEGDPFGRLRLKERGKNPRPPFERQFVSDVLVKKTALKTMDHELRMIVWAMASTGAGPAELCGLLPEEIRLDHKVPHIALRENPTRGVQKVHYRIREIPIVGSALEAFRAYPQGFLGHKGKPDSASSAINKFFRENQLMPSEKHSLYSLRHTFQDSLTEVEAPDRIQADLMGHKYVRPKYGKGPSLDQKLSWIERVAFYP